MNELTQCPDPDTLVTLLYDDEGESAERDDLEAHLQACRACADLLASLDCTRGTLGAWPAPRPPLGFARVQFAEPPLWGRVLPWTGMAAAALLTLAASAGLAGLDIRYDAQGVTLRTGWQAAPPAGSAASVSASGVPVSGARPSGVPTDPRTAWVTRAAAGEPPWRADFDLLGEQLREELAAQARASDARLAEAFAAAAARPLTAAASVLDEDRLMRRIAEQISQSEIRQQQNLALRVAELGREFQVRRQADFVQFEQGLARVEQQRRDLIRRVAVSQAPQP